MLLKGSNNKDTKKIFKNMNTSPLLHSSSSSQFSFDIVSPSTESNISSGLDIQQDLHSDSESNKNFNISNWFGKLASCNNNYSLSRVPTTTNTPTTTPVSTYHNNPESPYLEISMSSPSMTPLSTNGISQSSGSGSVPGSVLSKPPAGIFHRYFDSNAQTNNDYQPSPNQYGQEHSHSYSSTSISSLQSSLHPARSISSFSSASSDGVLPFTSYSIDDPNISPPNGTAGSGIASMGLSAYLDSGADNVYKPRDQSYGHSVHSSISADFIQDQEDLSISSSSLFGCSNNNQLLLHRNSISYLPDSNSNQQRRYSTTTTSSSTAAARRQSVSNNNNEWYNNNNNSNTYSLKRGQLNGDMLFSPNSDFNNKRNYHHDNYIKRDYDSTTNNNNNNNNSPESERPDVFSFSSFHRPKLTPNSIRRIISLSPEQNVSSSGLSDSNSSSITPTPRDQSQVQNNLLIHNHTNNINNTSSSLSGNPNMDLTAFPVKRTKSGKRRANCRKRNICQYCSKEFSRPSSLQTHIYTHTGEKPFICTFKGCGKKFSVRSNLVRHMKLHEAKAKKLENQLQNSSSSVNVVTVTTTTIGFQNDDKENHNFEEDNHIKEKIQS